MEVLGKIDQAFILIENNTIHSYGSMDHLEASVAGKHIVEEINASNCMVLPSFVDSHTHLVFAKWREEEFEMRIKGKTYEEIAEMMGVSVTNTGVKLNRIKNRLKNLLLQN